MLVASMTISADLSYGALFSPPRSVAETFWRGCSSVATKSLARSPTVSSTNPQATTPTPARALVARIPAAQTAAPTVTVAAAATVIQNVMTKAAAASAESKKRARTRSEARQAKSAERVATVRERVNRRETVVRERKVAKRGVRKRRKRRRRGERWVDRVRGRPNVLSFVERA